MMKNRLYIISDSAIKLHSEAELYLEEWTNNRIRAQTGRILLI